MKLYQSRHHVVNAPAALGGSHETVELPSKGEVKVQPGDRLTLETPGGGYGTPP